MGSLQTEVNSIQNWRATKDSGQLKSTCFHLAPNHTPTHGQSHLILGGMKKRLTPKTIDALPPATGKRYEVHDALLPGLHLRVSATSGKVFNISKRINGRMKPFALATCPIVSLADARHNSTRHSVATINLVIISRKITRCVW